MNLLRIATLTLLGNCALSGLYGDTVTLRIDQVRSMNEVSSSTLPKKINGSITKLIDDHVTIVAGYKTGDQTLVIKLSNVEVIEFNRTTFNPDSAPAALGVGPPRPSGIISKLVPEPDTIVLRGQRTSCKVVTIDADLVRCAGPKGAQFERRVVVRILLKGE